MGARYDTWGCLRGHLTGTQYDAMLAGKRLGLCSVVVIALLGYLGHGEPGEPKVAQTAHAGSWNATPDGFVPAERLVLSTPIEVR